MTRKIFVIAIVFLVNAALIGTVRAQSFNAPEAGWMVDTKSGCKIWNPNPKPNESVAWMGPCVKGVAEGTGVLVWFRNGVQSERTEGQFVRGRVNGHAVSSWSSGLRYSGGWLDSKLHGQGDLIFPNGDRYVGNWNHGLPDGRGVLRKANGETYQGNWVQGCYNDGSRRMAIFKRIDKCQ